MAASHVKDGGMSGGRLFSELQNFQKLQTFFVNFQKKSKTQKRQGGNSWKLSVEIQRLR